MIWPLLPLLLAAIASPDVPDPARLRWRNGETLAGEIVQASANDVTWRSSFFTDPLVLGWGAISRIDQTRPPKLPEEPFSIVLRDGSHLCGELLSVDADAIHIRNARDGEVALKRSAVLSMRRRHGGALVYSGPLGDVGWEESQAAVRGQNGGNNPANNGGPNAQPAVPVLTLGAGGALAIPYWNRGAHLAVELPQSLDVEIRLRSNGRPDFALMLGGEGAGRARLETWDNELVLTGENQFKEVRAIGDSERSVALRLCWNRKTGECAVYSLAGELLTQWTFPEGKPEPAAGVYLQNKGRDLALELLAVRVWDGTPPPKVDPLKPRMELVDGRILEGEIETLADDAVHVRAGGGGAAGTSFPANEIDAIIFSTDDAKVEETPARLTFADGTLLFGRVSGFADGRLALQTSFTAEPLAVALEGFRQLLAHTVPPDAAPPEPPLAEMDKLIFNQVALHGKVVSTGEGVLRWMPAGGISPVRTAPGLREEMVRAAAPPLADSPALFYTSFGDVLPGKLRALDHTSVDFDSPYLEMSRLAASDLQAIQFSAAANHGVSGFEDPGWVVLKGDAKTLTRSGGTLHMEAGTAIAHPAAMQASEIRFAMPTENFATLRLRLYCDGTEGKGTQSILLSRWNERFTCGLEGEEGQFESQNQSNVGNTPCEVRLSIEEKSVIIFVNGAQVFTVPVEAGRRLGSGLILEPASMWSNPVNAVALTGFSAPPALGRTWLPEVSKETRLQTLTIPRFRKDDPPRQVLLAANGDVLRGEIEAATATALQFRSGLESLRVPLDRIRAAIWLKKPEPPASDAAAPSAAAEPPAKVLETRLPHRTRFGLVNLKLLVNYLEQQAPGLKITLSPEAKEDRRSLNIQLGGPSIGDAIEQVCTAFGMHSRVLANGQVLIEGTGRPAPPEMEQKTYWLKPEALPDTAAAQKTLAEKGIEFPPGASASWEPKARLLTVVNSAENQVKLLAVLDSDFGGSLGSPTHWVQFTNGARLCLAAEKFEPDFIIGHHPFYGKCRLPMQDVLSIRTVAYSTMPSIKALEGWQLVYASEPVIPGSGDNSPTLGQVGKTFKLPLLGGGDFDLAKEKGKVVVLDFWATWCGPCVKSLPGLIETMAGFPSDRVELIGLNQGEPPAVVSKFLEARGWKLRVAMDSAQEVAKQYGVDGIPHTVIIGPDGKVAWVNTGYRPDGDQDAAKAVQGLLDGAAKP